MRRILVLALGFGAATASAGTFTVTNISDAGAGSLRQVILDANANAGTDTIAFVIPGSGVHTVNLTTWLPTVTDAVTVDGYTQPGSSPNTLPLAQGTNAVLNVEIRGEAVTLAPCWEYAANGGLIRGLVMNRCPFETLHVTGSVTITGNFIGTTPAGTPLTDGSPQNRGIYAFGPINPGNPTTVVVGGPNPADRNLISGHTAFGLSEGVRYHQYVDGKIQGNLIGVDRTVSYAITNGLGVFCTSPLGVQVGGPGANEGNVIGGSISMGFFGTFSVFQGNFIGTNPSETANLGNLGGGVVINASVPGN